MAKNNGPQLTPPSPGGGPSRSQAKAERRAAAAAALQQEQRQKARRRVLVQVLVGLAVIVVVVGLTIFALTRSDDAPTASGSATSPPGLTSQGGVRFGADDATVTVEVVEDFQCPFCRRFEAEAGGTLSSYREAGQVAVEYRPIAFLDRASSTEYSSRALNASMCVLADAGKDAWMAMHEALYQQQPEEGSAGLSDSKLVELARAAGASDKVGSCISDRAYAGWGKQTTRTVLDSINSTPTVLVNGKALAQPTAAALEAAVKAAQDGQ